MDQNEILYKSKLKIKQQKYVLIRRNQKKIKNCLRQLLSYVTRFIQSVQRQKTQNKEKLGLTKIQGDSKVGAFLSPANKASKNKVQG